MPTEELSVRRSQVDLLAAEKFQQDEKKPGSEPTYSAKNMQNLYEMFGHFVKTTDNRSRYLPEEKMKADQVWANITQAMPALAKEQSFVSGMTKAQLAMFTRIIAESDCKLAQTYRQRSLARRAAVADIRAAETDLSSGLKK